MNLIYYFTGTGNSLIVAKHIQSILPETKLIPIAFIKKNHFQLKDDVYKDPVERIGFIFPVYVFGPPKIVKEFIEKYTFPPSKYMFSIATCAGSGGATFHIIKKILNKKKRKLNLGNFIEMPSNYIPMGGAVKEKKQKKLFQEAWKKIDTLMDSIIKNESRCIEKNFCLLNCFFSNIIYKIGIEKLIKEDKKFHWTDKCSGCGICEKICPVDNIMLKDGHPQWLSNCEQCMACIQWCPETAIEIGKNSIHKKRYHHPQITIQDMLAQKKFL